MTFLSIIIPFKKGRRYLKDCLESIAQQNLEDYEIILISNGAEEDIEDLYKDFDNVVLRELDEPLGVSKARNEALEIAEGDYVYFIDSDDYIYEDGLSRLVEKARLTGADFINGQRVSTYYIKNRFSEELEGGNARIIRKKSDDEEFSMRLLVGEKDDVEVLSVLHALIKRENLTDFKFDESRRHFADYPLMVGLLNSLDSFVGVENAVYAKRISDDFINLPSLGQEMWDKGIMPYLEEYKTVKTDVKSQLVRDLMAEKLFGYYYETFSRDCILKSSDGLDMFMSIADDFRGNALQNREINALRAKDKPKVMKMMKLRVNLKRVMHLISEPWMIYHTLYRQVYNKRPVNDRRIVFESFSGDFYSDSPKYIYEYLLEHYGDEFEYVWIINDGSAEIPGNPVRTKRFSLKYHKLMATSKYWVINTRQAGRLVKRPQQVILSTWHGTPLKKLGFDMGNIYIQNPRTKETYIDDSSDWDYFISPNPFSTEIFRRAFAYNGEILESGYPRNDILYNATEDDVRRIREKLNLPEGKKVILYAPTWRDDDSYDIGKVKFKLKLDLEKLEREISDDYIVLVRNHYLITDSDVDDYKDFAFDVSRYDDIGELYLITDVLITDYSSVFFDFANLRRPMLFYMYDLDRYEQELRGFYIDIHEEVPGPILKTTQDVVDALKNIDEISLQYAEKYDAFRSKYCGLEDGNSTKRVVERVWGKG
jgi:CDP-glycerol glycerophosphotransferase